MVDTWLLEANRDVWVWHQPRFSVKAVYHVLCGQLPPKNIYITQRCSLIWKRHIPLKIRIFGWLLLRQHLITRSVRQCMFSDSPVSCPLYGGGPEDCSHLFFQCSLAQEAWRGAVVARLSVTSEETFWSSLSGGFFKREVIEGGFLPHCGRYGSTGTRSSSGASPHPAMPLRTQPKGFYLSWHRGGVGPSNFVPLL